jgi:multiple sugar transport system substrate-binding protein
VAAPVLAACGAPPAPPVAPTPAAKAPEKPAEAAKPAAPAAQPAAPAAQPAATSAPAAAKPAEAAKPSAQAPAAPAPTSTPPPPQLTAGQKLVTFMYNRTEISEQEQAAFTQKNPNIQTYLVTADLVALMAMTAAGTPPDFYRVQAPDIPTFILRKMARDLTDSFKTSTVIKMDDLSEANKNYMFDEKLNVGTGKIYGMVKDWSPDLSLFMNKKIMGEAGVTVPADDTILTYDQLMDLARKSQKKSGDRVEILGIGGAMNNWLDRVMEVQLNQAGASFWDADMGKINLQTPEAKKVLQFWHDVAKENLTFNPLNPITTGSPSDYFVRGQVAIAQYGYWFSGRINGTDAVREDCIMLQAPKWGDKHISPTVTATGALMHTGTKVFDEAWKMYEWFHGGEQAVIRARSGWGVPGLKSLYKEMPTTTPFQQQVQKILAKELAISDTTVRYNPYINQSQQVALNSFTGPWNKYLEQVLRNQMSFDQLVANLEKDVNTAIKEGKERLS